MIYIDRAIKTPYYLQIYEQIQNDILSERLKPGDYLTGSRILSRELGVGRNTVNNAYAQLAAEGYIESEKGKGFAVLDITEWKPISISRVPANTKFYDTKSEEALIYDLSYGNYSSKYFPTALWKRYTNEALTDENISDINYYQDRQGSPMLRKQLVEYLRQSRGVLCNESQILITGGLQHSLELVCKLFNGSVAMEEPGYDGALAVFRNNNIPVYPIRMDDQGIIVSHLRKIEKDTSFAYITPSHQFPTGVTMTIRRRYELLDWAKSSDSYIFEDDYDSEYRYNTNPIPALQSIDRDDRVIYFGTFSKSLSPSTRIAFVLLPNRLMPGY